MTITSNDIKLYQSQDNTDNDSGGGSRTSTEIVDGDVNNLFPDISRIDTVSGDVALRKIFPTVTTSNRDVYYGAHSMVRKPPSDPKVSALIFHTDDPYDTRIEAQDKIESYVVASYLEGFYLYGNHVVGAKSVTFLQTLTSQVPEVAEVYLLKEGDDEQYIRVSGIDAQEVILSYSFGGAPIEYPRRRIICEIDQALEFAFVGSSFHPVGQLANTADTWATQVADAAKFYATKELLEDAEVDDTVIKVDSIFEQLVPASKKQTPLINQSALVQGSSLLPTGNLTTETIVSSIGVPMQLVNAITPNSITRISATNYIDDGLGNIINTSNNNEIVGSVDYKSGVIIQNVVSGGVVVDYEIANAFDSNIQFTGEIKITQENVGNVFIQRLSPLPSIGDLYIDYRSNGKWYRFASAGNRDSGNETLGGSSGIGSGALSDNTDGTGTVSMTLASLPDIDSSIIISWGSSERLSDRTSLISAQTEAYMSIPLSQENIDPLSFVMQLYTTGTASYKNITATSDGTLIDSHNSNIVGSLDFINGELIINSTSGVTNRFGDLNETHDLIIDFDYSTAGIGDDGEIKTSIASANPVGNMLPLTAQNTSAGTFSFSLGEVTEREGITISFNVYTNYLSALTLESDSSGVLRKWGRHFQDTTTYGTIAANGDVSIQLPQQSYKERNPSYLGSIGTSALYVTVNKYPTVSRSITITHQSESPTSYSQSHNITDKYENIISYKIKTLPSVVGEVGFNFPTPTVKVHSNNNLMYDSNNIEIGVIDKTSGEIELNCFTRPDVFSLEFTKLFTDDIGEDADTVLNYAFRTAATKLTTSSFQLYYETANGTYIATSDGNGVITGTDIDSLESYVDTQTGMASIVFTEQALPSSFKYDAVAESSLPLDPELLGLNPVRLPSDGRVPVFKAGYHLIIFNEVITVTTNATPLADDIETLARSGQAYIEVIDANGKRLDPNQYTADRVAGTVTFANPLTLEDKYGAALTAPFSIVDRVEDMLLATDVQINGLITLSAGLTHDYLLGVTKVASSLVWGDTGARVYNLFSQEIWDSGSPTWSDDRIGDNTTAQYDNINYPIQIDNQSSSAGRWAIIFKSSTSVDVVHEKLGVVQSNVAITIEDVEPVNPATGLPYFTMPREGFGSGWVTNNVIRLNTDSGDNNMWVIRTVKSGALSNLTDSIDIEVRGDAN